MIKFQVLYGRVGKPGGKYTSEVTMDWMNPNYEILSIDQLSIYFSKISIETFVTEIIEMFKVDTIHYEVLVMCLNLESINNIANSEMEIDGKKFDISISGNKLQMVTELELDLEKPLAIPLLDNILDETKFDVDRKFELNISISRNNNGTIRSIRLKHIEK